MYDAQIFFYVFGLFVLNVITLFFSFWNLIDNISLDFSTAVFSVTCILLCKTTAPGNGDILLSLLRYIVRFLSCNNQNTQSRQDFILAKRV